MNKPWQPHEVFRVKYVYIMRDGDGCDVKQPMYSPRRMAPLLEKIKSKQHVVYYIMVHQENIVTQKWIMFPKSGKLMNLASMRRLEGLE